MVVAAPRPPAAAATRANAGRGRRRARGAQRVVNLPNDINAPTARINYYKLFLEFMNYKDDTVFCYNDYYQSTVCSVLYALN